MKNLNLLLLIFLLISCNNSKKDNSNNDFHNLNDQYIGFHYSYDLKDKFGDNVIVRGKTINIPLSKYQFLIQDDSKVFLKQTNMEDNSQYNYEGDIKKISGPNQNPVVYSLNMLSNDGSSSPKMILTFNLEKNSIFCNEESSPYEFSLLRKKDYEEFDNMSYGDMNYTYFVQNFIDLIENDKIETLSKLFRGYNDYIRNTRDFIEQYDSIFTSKVKFKITSSDIEKDWGTFGWRGIFGPEIKLGYDGTILSLPESKQNKRFKNKIEELERETLHKSLSDYDYNVFSFRTEKFLVRIDKLENGDLRYSSWGSGKNIMDKPSLILFNGKRIYELGSVGNNYIEFSSSNIKYKIWENINNDKSYPYTLEVYQNEKLILEQDGGEPYR